MNIKKLDNYKYVQQGKMLNQYSTKPNMIDFNKAGIDEFNRLYKLFKNSDLNPLERTPSGGIAINSNNQYAYDVRIGMGGLGIITAVLYGRTYVFRIEHIPEEDQKPIKSYQCFKLFTKKCLEFGINLEDYAIPNGEQIKAEIPSPYIMMLDEYKGLVLNSVHHLDFHSSYASGLAATHTEFKPVVEYFYTNRDKYKQYKDVLNLTIGIMQSLKVKTIHAKYAQLSKDAIINNNYRIETVAEDLSKAGREIIGFNTDGIWYRGKIYHGPLEGTQLGQWSNDHLYCKFRAKSDGAYEYIENGLYKPVVRGRTSLDDIKKRDDWQWGDIMHTDLVDCQWDEKDGYILRRLEL